MRLNDPPSPKPHPILRRLLRAIFRIFYFYKAEGRENLPTGGPVLLAANHQSYLDPFLVTLGQDRPTSFMAWKALFAWRPFARLLHKFGAFPVDLDNWDPGAYRLALACLKRGGWLVIFPEGGRSPDGSLRELRQGVARLALHGGAPIVPVRIEGAFEVMSIKHPWPRPFKPLRVTYGPPILPPRGPLGVEERDQAAQAIMDQLRAFLDNRNAECGMRNAE